MANLLVHGKEQRNLTGELHLAGGNRPSQPQQNRGRELIVQKATLDVAALGDHGTRIHSDDVAGLDTQARHVVLGVNVLVKQDLHILLDRLDFFVCNVRRRLGI